MLTTKENTSEKLNQRDQGFLNLTKDEVQLKKKLIDGLMEATKEPNKALDVTEQSMVAVRESIGDGLALLTITLSGVQTQPTHMDMHSVHMFHTIIWLFNFLTPLVEMFLMTITESHFGPCKRKLPEESQKYIR